MRETVSVRGDCRASSAWGWQLDNVRGAETFAGNYVSKLTHSM